MVRKFIENFDNSYYKNISDLEYQGLSSRFLKDRKDSFNDDEVDLVRSLFVDLSLELFRVGHQVRIIYWYPNDSFYDDDSVKVTLYIDKYEDEWFFVWFYVSDLRSKYKRLVYRCDQIDGLLKCIKEEIL